jgi:hypothetical protein
VVTIVVAYGGAALAEIARSEPDAADDVFLIAQDGAGKIVGETIYGSSVSIPA